MISPKFVVFVRDGKVRWETMSPPLADFKQWVASLRGGAYFLYLKRAQRTRSIQMNRYYWGVIVKLISDEMGVDPMSCHQYLKGEFGHREFFDDEIIRALLERTKDNPGRQAEMMQVAEYGVIRSTTTYNVEEMQEYWERIYRWAAEVFSMRIPEPNEVVS